MRGNPRRVKSAVGDSHRRVAELQFGPSQSGRRLERHLILHPLVRLTPCRSAAAADCNVRTRRPGAECRSTRTSCPPPAAVRLQRRVRQLRRRHPRRPRPERATRCALPEWSMSTRPSSWIRRNRASDGRARTEPPSGPPSSPRRRPAASASRRRPTGSQAAIATAPTPAIGLPACLIPASEEQPPLLPNFVLSSSFSLP